METIANSQMVSDFDPQSRDYIGYHNHEGLLSFVVFRMRQGKLIGTEIFHGKEFSAERSPEAVGDLVSQFILRYYDEIGSLPAMLYVPSHGTIKKDLQRFLRSEFKVDITVTDSKSRVLSGRDKNLLRMAEENARQDSYKRAREVGDDEGIQELKTVFRLPNVPRRIEGFDIAQLQGKHTVAALVSFKNGIPDKKEYRYFNIKSLNGKIDDYEAMREAVARRYSRVVNEKKSMPDLIVIDGGKGQLNAACAILESLGLQGTPIVALAKREEEVFIPGRSQGVQLPEGTAGLRILQAVRDEAHRFGTTLNQKQRSKDVELEAKQVKGFGPVRSQKVLVEFTTYKAAVEAGAGEISRRAGIPLAVAEDFIDYFNKKNADE